MKLVLNTQQLQNLVTKAIKGSSNNKLLPMTSLMSITYDGNGHLALTTTDMTNYLTVTLDEASTSDDELRIVVMAESFAKLISKMTSENVTLEFDGEQFTVSGGKSNYKIELPLDVDGSLVKLEVPTVKGKNVQTVKWTSIKEILATAKSALATTLDTPCYTAYYIGENVLSTDTYKICCIKEKLFDEPVLISSDTMDLLDLAESDLVCTIDGDSIKFETSDGKYSLSTKAYDGIETYSVDAITSLVESEFESHCVLNKNDMLRALDRLSLFVGQYDRNVINMSFKSTQLILTNKAKAGVEEVDYVSNDKGAEFECAIDIEMLTSQIKASPEDEIKLYYGLDNCIKIADNDIIQIIALFNE